MRKPANPIRVSHYAGMGKIIVAWARVEAHVITALESMLKIRRADALVIFWHMPHKERVARFGSLLSMDHNDKNGPIRKEFDTLVRRIEAAYAVRNTVAHGLVKFTGKGLAPDEFTPQRFESEAKKIDRLGADFREFFKTNYKAKFVYK
jgi:hypothetical protein